MNNQEQITENVEKLKIYQAHLNALVDNINHYIDFSSGKEQVVIQHIEQAQNFYFNAIKSLSELSILIKNK